MAIAAHGAGSKQVSFERERGVHRVDVAHGIAHVIVDVDTDEKRAEQTLRVLRTLADTSIPISLIKLHRSAVSFAVEGDDVDQTEACIKELGLEYTMRRGLARISVIASSMRDLTGVMVNIADALQEAGVRLYGVGDSHNSVQCLVEGERTEAGARQLRKALGLEGQRG